jgi:hypothetical protein
MEGKLMKIPNICPRCCDNWIPNNLQPGEYPGAISRTDNKTEICSECGTAEALQDFLEGGCTKKEDWEIIRK